LINHGFTSQVLGFDEEPSLLLQLPGAGGSMADVPTLLCQFEGKWLERFDLLLGIV